MCHALCLFMALKHMLAAYILQVLLVRFPFCLVALVNLMAAKAFKSHEKASKNISGERVAATKQICKLSKSKAVKRWESGWFFGGQTEPVAGGRVKGQNATQSALKAWQMNK